MEDFFKTIPGTNGRYMASINGNIKSVDRLVECNCNGGFRNIKPRILKQKTKKNGYKEVNLYIENQKSKMKYVHRLVYETFIGEIEKGKEINHIDGNKSNNKLSNLEAVTPSENINHSYKVLKRKPNVKYGEKSHFSKITSIDVLDIKRRYFEGEASLQIHKEYEEKISLSNLRKICYGKTWKHLNNYSSY